MVKKFIIKLIIFSSPFALAIFVELFILPIDFFCFRVWEAVNVQGTSINTGQFYPDMEIEKQEEGWLAHHTKYAVKNDVKWITDIYGYRKKNTDQKAEIVLIGDSFMAGDALTQKDMLSEVLEEQLNVCVYPLAPANIKTFLNDPRFSEYLPRIVILGATNLSHLRSPKGNNTKKTAIKIRRRVFKLGFVRTLDTLWNRLWKANILQYYRARLTDAMGLGFVAERGLDIKPGVPMFFRPSFVEYDDAPVKSIVAALKRYDKAFDEKGIRFIVLPLPSKESIYYRYRKNPVRTQFMSELINGLKKAGVETVDTQTAFEDELKKENPKLLFHSDDSHWTGDAVKIAADLLVKLIREPEQKEPPDSQNDIRSQTAVK